MSTAGVLESCCRECLRICAGLLHDMEPVPPLPAAVNTCWLLLWRLHEAIVQGETAGLHVMGLMQSWPAAKEGVSSNHIILFTSKTSVLTPRTWNMGLILFTVPYSWPQDPLIEN